MLDVTLILAASDFNNFISLPNHFLAVSEVSASLQKLLDILADGLISNSCDEQKWVGHIQHG